MKKFYNTLQEEQETIINIDYGAKKASFYTSRYSAYNRLYKKLGEPTQTYYVDKKISGASWEVSFEDRNKLSSVLNRTCVVGKF